MNFIRTIATTVISVIGVSVWALAPAAQEPPAFVEPPSPSVAEVLELDADERIQFFDQRITLHCNVCHSSEMIEQQQLTLPQWKAEVVKMVGWGATLPKGYEDLMAKHLNRKYPANRSIELPRLEPANAQLESNQADQAAVSESEMSSIMTSGLYTRQCANCHGTDGQGNEIGPRLTGRPMLTRPGQFAEHVADGRGRMPAFGKTISGDDVNALRRWLLGRTVSWGSKTD
jgi:mono/diheme cytochrome c family protein